jgi:hypothetical protein
METLNVDEINEAFDLLESSLYSEMYVLSNIKKSMEPLDAYIEYIKEEQIIDHNLDEESSSATDTSSTYECSSDKTIKTELYPSEIYRFNGYNSDGDESHQNLAVNKKKK